MQEFVLRGGTVVFPDRAAGPIDLLIRDGKIAGLLRPDEPVGEAIAEHSARGLHVFPGLIDAHLHFGLSGEKITEYATETRHAALGGFTTVLGYFLNNEAYTDVFKREQEYARTRAYVDYGFHFSTANELHIQELESYVKDYGVTSFKYFMNFKGEEGRYLGLDGTDDGYFYDLLQQAARVNATIVCHTENIELVNRIRRRVQAAGGSTLKDWSASKPPITEAEACLRAMYFAEKTGARIYIPHISTRMALDEVRKWRSRYDAVLVETCPHYLTHDENSTLGPIGKANPPFRSPEDVQAMWQGLADGTIDVVASDHVPRKRAAKDKGLWQASQGFPGTGTILPVLLSEGYHKGRLSLQRVCDVVTAAPARIFNLEPQKGRIAVGADADLTLVDLEKERVVKAEELGSYADYSLYDGWKLKGWAVKTIVRGITVMEEGRVVGQAGHGKYLWRKLDLGVTSNR